MCSFANFRQTNEKCGSLAKTLGGFWRRFLRTKPFVPRNHPNEETVHSLISCPVREHNLCLVCWENAYHSVLDHLLGLNLTAN